MIRSVLVIFAALVAAPAFAQTTTQLTVTDAAWSTDTPPPMGSAWVLEYIAKAGAPTVSLQFDPAQVSVDGTNYRVTRKILTAPIGTQIRICAATGASGAKPCSDWITLSPAVAPKNVIITFQLEVPQP